MAATLAESFTHMLYLIKQYNLVSAKGRWCYAAGKQWQCSAGFMASIVCRGPGSAPEPLRSRIECGTTFTCSTFCDGSESETTLLCVRCWSSAVCNHQFSVPVLADVRRRRSWSAHARRRALDGAAREEISADEERQRGTDNLAITACFLAAGGVYVNDVLFF